MELPSPAGVVKRVDSLFCIWVNHPFNNRKCFETSNLCLYIILNEKTSKNKKISVLQWKEGGLESKKKKKYRIGKMKRKQGEERKHVEERKQGQEKGVEGKQEERRGNKVRR